MSLRLGVSMVVVAGGAILAQAPAPEVVAVLDRAAAVVAAIEQRAPALVAEERYTQTAETNRNLGGSTMGVTGGGAGPAMQEGDTVRTKQRSRSEVLLVKRQAAPLTWSAVRNVLDVGGKATGNSAGQLDGLAANRAGLEAQWTSLSDASRKVHVGAVDHDTVAPTAALAALRADQRDRMTFRKDGEEKVRGTLTWKIAFAELRGPTLFKTRGNVPLPARGTLWIDPQTGKVFRTKVEAGDGLTTEQWRIEVDYVADAALDAMLPSEMRDRYQSLQGKTDGKATYSGYRVIGAPAP